MLGIFPTSDSSLCSPKIANRRCRGQAPSNIDYALEVTAKLKFLQS